MIHSYQLKRGFELASFELLFYRFDGVRTTTEPEIFFISWYSLWFIQMLLFGPFPF